MQEVSNKIRKYSECFRELEKLEWFGADSGRLIKSLKSIRFEKIQKVSERVTDTREYFKDLDSGLQRFKGIREDKFNDFKQRFIQIHTNSEIQISRI